MATWLLAVGTSRGTFREMMEEGTSLPNLAKDWNNWNGNTTPVKPIFVPVKRRWCEPKRPSWRLLARPQSDTGPANEAVVEMEV